MECSSNTRIIIIITIVVKKSEEEKSLPWDSRRRRSNAFFVFFVQQHDEHDHSRKNEEEEEEDAATVTTSSSFLVTGYGRDRPGIYAQCYWAATQIRATSKPLGGETRLGFYDNAFRLRREETIIIIIIIIIIRRKKRARRARCTHRQIRATSENCMETRRNKRCRSAGIKLIIRRRTSQGSRRGSQKRSRNAG